MSIVLIGHAYQFFDRIIAAAEQMGKSGMSEQHKKGFGRMALNSVETINTTDDRTKKDIVYDGKMRRLMSPIMINEYSDLAFIWNNLSPVALTIHFITPTQIRKDKKMIRENDFYFPVFIEALLNRVSGLAMYSNFIPEFDGQFMIMEACQVETSHKLLKWSDPERYSSPQHTNMKYGGFTGFVTFQGPITPFLPLIKLGEQIHVGRWTKLGNGMYSISGESNIL